jgi:acetolactate synthase-1/2/3 large subunit
MSINGAECLLQTLVHHGIDTCFLNPGTSEMQFVAALDRVPALRGVLCLQENTCSGAADGYARMLGRPAATLLHLGPGLANALSNLHNAQKARSPIVNIVGEHATGHKRYDSPLASNTEAFAQPVSSWVYTTTSAEDVGPAAARAIQAAMTPPGHIASLIIPADHSWLPSGERGEPLLIEPRKKVDASAIEQCAGLCKQPGTAFYTSGHALQPAAVDALRRIHAATGVPVYMNRFAAVQPRGRSRRFITRMPYFPDAAEAALASVRHLVLLETGEPVSFFAYPNRKSTMKPESCQTFVLTTPEQDSIDALERLADRFPIAGFEEKNAEQATSDADPLSPSSIGSVLRDLLPEDAIVVDEMVSSGEAANRHLQHAAPHWNLPVCGGSIGQGLPLALGAAIARPDLKTIALEGDGSAMYTFQALWTMARERSDVVVVIFANRRYRILEIEMERTGVPRIAPRAQAMLDIAGPEIDFVGLSKSAGVPAERVDTTRRFRECFAAACRERGPFLIEAVLPS